MNKNLFFQAILGFIGNVHANTHSLMKDARSNEVTPQQHSILEYVFFSKAVTTSQVADCLNISLPNASRELKKLSRLELIVKETDERNIDPDDIFADADIKRELMKKHPKYTHLYSEGGRTRIEECSEARVGNAFKNTYHSSLKKIEENGN